MRDWLWIPITIFAAFMQNARTVVQKHLRGRLSTNGANYTRFVFGMPVAVGYVALLALAGGEALPAPGMRFFAWVTWGGIAQILATSLLIEAMSRRNFAAGVAWSKTEAVQAAVFETLVLGAALTAGGVAAIAIATLGVMLISARKSERPVAQLLTGWTDPAALIGLASGALFGISAVGFRAASLSLGHESFLMSAGYTLAWAQGLQTLMLGAWLAWREPGELGRVRANWRVASLSGITGTLGSLGWFTAMTLQLVAYVRTLGLVELVFTFLAARLFFGERSGRAELGGTALLVVGIAVLLLLR
jgi:drug/metabolite transporter (DMT)-like permease